MADNTVLNLGSGGDTARTKDRSGVKTSIVAIDLNPGGSESLMGGVMPTGGQKAQVAVTIARPADTIAYTIGDSVNTSTSAPTVITFANVVRLNGLSGYVTGVRATANLKSITPRLRLHLFNASPTLVNDNAAFKSLFTDESKRVASIDLPAMLTPADTTNSDMSRAEDMTLRVPVIAASGTTSLFGVIETLDAFTPSSGMQITLTLVVDQD